MEKKRFVEEDEECCVQCGMEIEGWGIPSTGTVYGNTRTGYAHVNKKVCARNIKEEAKLQDFQNALKR